MDFSDYSPKLSERLDFLTSQFDLPMSVATAELDDEFPIAVESNPFELDIG